MSKWFPFQENNLLKQKVLFCFHHAGGSAAVYRSWIEKGGEFSVLPVELPGKSTRMKEHFIENMSELSGYISEAVLAYAEQREIYLFGHSMGAAIAFRVAYQLENVFHRKVAALIVAGRQPPHFPNRDQYQSYMGTEVLLQEMIRISGAPEYLLKSRELQDFVLPLIRRDYKLNESFEYRNEQISSPILAYAGTYDDDAPIAIMEHWKEVTSGKFWIEPIEGNHFFVTDSKIDFLQKMIKDLDQVICKEEKCKK